MDALNSCSVPHHSSSPVSRPERSQRIQKILEPTQVLAQISSGQRFEMQNYFAGVHGDIGWMRDPFQGCPYSTQPHGAGAPGFASPFFPPMPPMAGGYWDGIQGMLSMQIAMLDRMIALVMLMMQNQGGQGGQGGHPPCDCPPPPPVDTCPPEVQPTPPPVDTCPPETVPAPPEVEPAPPEVEPAPPEVEPAPPEVEPCPPESEPAPPEVAPVEPAPADPRAERVQKLDQFRSRLLQASPVSVSSVHELARSSGLSDREGEALVTFLKLGRNPNQFNFAQPKMRALLDIFVDSAKADGDVRAVARALQQYSREVNDLLPEECFDALLSVAGNPPGSEVRGGNSLKQQLSEANGWGPGWTGRGCNMQNREVVSILDSWANRDSLQEAPEAPVEPQPEAPAPREPEAPAPVEPQPETPSSPQEQRARAWRQISSALTTLGANVSPNTVVQTVRDQGLNQQEGENLVTFLSASLRQGRNDNLDFTRQTTRDLVGVFVQAAAAGGDVRGIARALLEYSDKCPNRLTQEAFNALLFAGGEPPGAEVAGAQQLRTNLEQQDGWTGLLRADGVDMRHEGVRRVLESTAGRTTAVAEDTPPAAEAGETPEARTRRLRNFHLDRFRDDLRTSGNSVSREQLVSIAERNGLGNWEGENLWKFLENIGTGLFGSTYDFTNPEVLEYVEIYIQAAKSGDIQGAVGALRRYADSPLTRGRNLGEGGFDALMEAAGNPPGTPPEGASQLKRQLEQNSRNWVWEGGFNFTRTEMSQVLDNFRA